MRKKSKRPVLRRRVRTTLPPTAPSTPLGGGLSLPLPVLLGETGPSREVIKPQVLEILNRVANPNTLPVEDEAKNLTDDHGITDTGKENLAPSFSRISRDKYGGLPVSRADSKACKIVGDSITLVWKRANNDATWKPK